MILRHLDGHHYIVRQPEHARQSGVILAHLRPEFLGGMTEQWDLLRACRQHDDGWAEWEKNPRLQENGLPVNFCDINKDDHADNWTRTIFGQLMYLGPAAASYVARHASALQDMEEAEGGQDRQELIETLVKRAWPEAAPDEGKAVSQAGFQALYACDALSLIALAGWKNRLTLKLHHSEEGEVSIEAWREGDWNVRVSPWPFCTDIIKGAHVDAVCLQQGEESAAAAILRDPRDYLVRVPIDYLPG